MKRNWIKEFTHEEFLQFVTGKNLVSSLTLMSQTESTTFYYDVTVEGKEFIVVELTCVRHKKRNQNDMIGKLI